MNLTLTRYAYLHTHTQGRLSFQGGELATIERPWLPSPSGRGGVLSQSCVPDGEYRLIPHDSGRFPGTYALVNEDLGVWYQSRPEGQPWGRTAILVHVGNRVRDVIGCIAVGLTEGVLEGEHAVLRSRVAMDRLREVLGRDEHTLTIRPARTVELVT